MGFAHALRGYVAQVLGFYFDPRASRLVGRGGRGLAAEVGDLDAQRHALA